jgi:hypothetical protein
MMRLDHLLGELMRLAETLHHRARVVSRDAQAHRRLADLVGNHAVLSTCRRTGLRLDIERATRVVEGPPGSPRLTRLRSLDRRRSAIVVRGPNRDRQRPLNILGV